METSLTGTHRWRRVLLFRSCRMPEFTKAVARLRADHPDADIWALTHEDFAGQVLAAGAHHAIGHRQTRLSLRRLGPGLVRRLRRLKFDAVAIPLMDAQLRAAANLMRLAAVIGAPAVALYPGAAPARTLDRAAVRRLAALLSLQAPDGVLILWQMVRAACRRRPPPGASGRHGRARVLHVINSLALGGAQAQCVELLNRTPSDRFEVEVLVLAHDGDFSRGRLRRDDVSITYLDEWTGTDTTIEAIAAHCRRGAYDIVHTWLPLANMLGSAAARLAGVPRVVTSVRSLNPGNYPQWRRWWYRPADVLAARLADVVTVNARALATDHAGWALMDPRKIAVVHNGIEPASIGEDIGAARVWLRSQLRVPSDAAVLGIVGRLAVEKDQATFVRAVARLRREWETGAARGAPRPLRAVIVGDGPCEDPLRALVRELALDDCVTFLGARPDARRITAGLDVLALTSRIEGFPNVLLEAGMLGIPLVSSDVGGVGDLVTDPETLFRWGDADAAAAAIRGVLSDRARADARAEALRRRCLDHFTADRMAGAWLSLYQPGVRWRSSCSPAPPYRAA